MRIDVITIFPEMVHHFVRYGVLGRALERGLLMVETWNPREYAPDARKTIDDRPCGGGPGMVMMAPPLNKALSAAKARQRGNFRTIYLSPQGRSLDQKLVNEMATRDGLILLSGRYRGVDERVLSHVDEELSLGDYVISGGEAAAMVVIDAVARQVKGVLGDEDSARQDSLVNGYLDCAHYTRPVEYEGQIVPEVLLCGDHERIRRWRLKNALGRTLEKRPDLLLKCDLNVEENALLGEYAAQHALQEVLADQPQKKHREVVLSEQSH